MDSDVERAVTPSEAMRLAEQLRDESVAAGDQSYGAVVVREGRVVGFGRSGVVTRRDPTAHAETTAIRDAAARLSSGDLSGCTMYSTAHPCPMCETAAFFAGIDEMIQGPDLTSLGPPRRAERPD